MYKKKKGQAAMEYLMTYGWAILIILIALGALFYLGIFKPKTGNTCMGAAPASCSDVKLVPGQLTLVLGAGGVSSATITNVHLSTPVAVDVTPAAPDNVVTDGLTAKTFAFAGITAADLNKKFSGTAAISYMLEGSTMTHTTTVQFSGTVEAAAA